MPIYEYRCSACGHELEVLQKLSEPPLSDCPECSRPTLAKLISPVGFQLKGSGWYATDFKGGGKPADKASKDGEGAAKPAATSEAKSDSTSDSKSSAKADAAGTPSGGCGGNCSCH